ncbi:MAG: T9SS type A sorting domain-containing protein [Bacteroidota bacterium]
MKKQLFHYLLIPVILLISFTDVFGQGIKRQSIGSYGSGGSAGSIFVNQTVGQPFFTMAYNSSQLALTPGFQQPVTYAVKKSESLPSLSELEIFPNPATENFKISVPEVMEEVNLTVTDVNGRRIIEKKIPELFHYEVDCSRWENGLYFIIVSSGKKESNYISKIIISK